MKARKFDVTCALSVFIVQIHNRIYPNRFDVTCALPGRSKDMDLIVQLYFKPKHKPLEGQFADRWDLLDLL